MAVRVLVIEDEPAIGDFIVRGLREEGFAVDWAATGPDGWHYLSTASWDVVLLDWWLPGIDGLSLLRKFRREDSATPVLFLTARDAVSDRVTGLDAGANDYLCKPFAFEELLARIRVLTRPAGRADRVFTAGGVRIDPITQRAERGGRPLALTAKEFGLLLFLVRHAGQVLGRNQIYEAVWDEKYDGESNTLEVHVAELRRKLEARGPRVIHTVRGRGYLFGDSAAEGPA
jgi:two-component system copper resistance phosphate regulon response regulator CusR